MKSIKQPLTEMKIKSLLVSSLAITLVASNLLNAQTAPQKRGNSTPPAVSPMEMKPEMTEVWEPQVGVVTPGKTASDAPSDAIILFDGKSLSKWVSTKDEKQAAPWLIKDGYFEVKQGAGDIQTIDKFGDCQLHLEWSAPDAINLDEGQMRGNSGIFFQNRYELQVLDSYNNRTYRNGQAGSIYKQAIPLLNACKHTGEWQSYDIVWKAPRFTKKGKLKSPASVNAFQNGVLVQDNFQLKGETMYIGKPSYKAHGATSIKLQDHGDPSEPISFRNIWVREL